MMGGSKTASSAAQADTEMQDEIDRIMSDIKELTNRIDEVPAQKPKKTQRKMKLVEPAEQSADPAETPDDEINPSESTGLEEFRARGTDEAPLEETLGGLLTDEPAGPSLLDEVSAESEQVEADIEAQLNVNQIEEDLAQIEKEETMANEDYGTSGAQNLTMNLNGNMTLKLKYDFEGQEVTISFSAGALIVRLSDGTEFKVPVRGKNTLKRVA